MRTSGYDLRNIHMSTNGQVLLISHQFHRHILKNRTMVFPTTFISTSEKVGVGLEKQVAVFLFQFHPVMGSPVFLF